MTFQYFEQPLDLDPSSSTTTTTSTVSPLDYEALLYPDEGPSNSLETFEDNSTAVHQPSSSSSSPSSSSSSSSSLSSSSSSSTLPAAESSTLSPPELPPPINQAEKNESQFVHLDSTNETSASHWSTAEFKDPAKGKKFMPGLDSLECRGGD